MSGSAPFRWGDSLRFPSFKASGGGSSQSEGFLRDRAGGGGEQAERRNGEGKWWCVHGAEG
jgi:hypothetical protein